MTNVKNPTDPYKIGKVQEKIVNIVLEFSDEYSRMNEKDQKMYISPNEWKPDSFEYKWYRKTFSELNMSDVLDLSGLACNLGFKALLEVCCFHIAGSITGKSSEEMRKMLGMEDDFSTEEIQKIVGENSWHL
jgi:hypothetical protein